MSSLKIEQKEIKVQDRCRGCKHCRGVTGSGNWSFLGCYHKPYQGEWVVEIKDCPKEC